MSGFLGPLTGNIELLIGRPAPLIIGTLLLQDHEVPGRISIGGAQAVTIHKLPGGGRIIDAMGSDQGSISWHGLFIGPTAAGRARALDIMRQQGFPQVLSFGDYTFNIVIVHFEYDYRDRGAVISYRLKSEIIPDASGDDSGSADLGFSIQDDLGTGLGVLQTGAAAALAYAALSDRNGAAQLTATASAMGLATTGLGAALVVADAAASGGSAGYGGVQTGLSSAGETIASTIAGSSIAAPGAGTGGLTFATAAGLSLAAGQAAAMAALVRAGSNINRVGANLAVSGGPLPQPYVNA
ncbi:hypothetical protein [Lichenicola sp.]|uniref:hypothetical protein n=1 Tax=Lichenicola sp. TaxID=2804529 RepID=UPI003B008D65